MCVECFLFASKNNNKTDRTTPCVNVFSPKLCQFCSGRRSSAEVNTQHNTTWWPCFAFQITAPEHLYNMVENLCFRFVPPTPSLSLPPLQPLFVLYTQRAQRLECPYFVAVFLRNTPGPASFRLRCHLTQQSGVGERTRLGGGGHYFAVFKITIPKTLPAKQGFMHPAAFVFARCLLRVSLLPSAK